MISAAAGQALAREAESPNGSGTTTSPGVTTSSVAGSTTIPVKIGTNSQTRLTKNAERQPRRRGAGERDAA